MRRLVHAAGLRYRVDAKPIHGLNRRADLVFRSARVAVFIDGCYWHGCPDHGTKARTHSDYWSAKISRNVARDRDTDAVLTAADWLVIRVWEHSPADVAAREIVSVVRSREA